MKKKCIKWINLLIVIVLFAIPTLNASASQATSYTYTLNEKGYFTRTQDAYLPDKTITDLGLLEPDDLFVDKDNMLYIADSGNSRIVKYSIDTGKVVGILEHESLQSPKGVFVTNKGDIYVADPRAKAVFLFTKDFQLVDTFIKPDAPAFKDTTYEPLRISVDNGGNMYIVGEGVYNGVIQLARTGEFLGYFTVNKTRLTLMQAVQNAILTRTQLSKLVYRVPTTFSNIFTNDAGIIYTTTMGTNEDGLKKHNTSGGNMFQNTVFGIDAMTDVYVDKNGIIYTSSTYGYITIYSSQGELIFNFGSYGSDVDVSGIFSTLPTIAVDNNGVIWAVDGEKGYLQSFKPTDYSLLVYSAMGLYEQGLYEEALDKWNEVLRYNQMSILAHNGVAKAYFKGGYYEEAMEHFKVSGDRDYFSEAFWEVRNDTIQSKLNYVIVICVIFWLLSTIIKYFDKERKLKRTRRELTDLFFKVPVLKDVLYMMRIPKRPFDRYYDIRVKKQGSTLGATIIYLLFFVIYILYKTSKGFIYQFEAVEDMDISALVIGFFVILSMFILCNYLVTSIKDGDGSLKQVYMIPAYGLFPVAVSCVLVTIMSYVLTNNESFILTIILVIGLGWSVVNIFLGFMTVHDYTFKDTIISFIITFIFMVIVIIMALIIIIMWEQLWGFLKTVGRELIRNVLS
jgi:hypothetical protein